ncbi:MAG: redoxin domain-containing protein [Anaerolineales bacterium]|nr:redoxin domain-containing protein [Anaerolineales bacterium]
MAQLRHDDAAFRALQTKILVIVPNGPKMIARYVQENANPYPILSDKGAKVAQQYQINTRRVIMIAAFTPSVFLVDQTGKIRYTNYATSYIKEPDNQEPLAVLAKMVQAD